MFMRIRRKGEATAAETATPATGTKPVATKYASRALAGRARWVELGTGRTENRLWARQVIVHLDWQIYLSCSSDILIKNETFINLKPI